MHSKQPVKSEQAKKTEQVDKSSKGTVSTVRTLGSVSRALRTLELLMHDRSGEIGVTQVAEALKVGKSTAHQILSTLHTHGFVGKDERTGRYHLGVRAIELGVAAMTGVGFGPALQSVLENLSIQTGETVSICMLADPDVLLVQRVETSAILRVDLRVGTRLPLFTSAAGKVLLAGLSDERLTAIIGRLSNEEAPTVWAEVDAVVKNGYAITINAPIEGISAIAAPLRDSTGKVVAALTIAGPSTRFLPEEHVQSTLETASVLSGMIGDAEGVRPN